jgi:DNA invertase Pin-like site-specific DNA recombinase
MVKEELTEGTCVVYARADPRDDIDLSLARQVACCEAFALKRGLRVGAVYVDGGSGRETLESRAGMAQLLAAVEVGAVGVVVTSKVEKVGRRLAIVDEFLERLGKHDAVLWAADEEGPSADGESEPWRPRIGFDEAGTNNAVVRLRQARIDRAGRPAA